ncbi:serine/threonine protein kinase [Sphaerisporangium album]|uniref:non-specific serine/threonine protein kinase n=1 Tax=Sphaerisporangium album TaxID=509200 RepID=A0A367FEC9_9ACTN|nr:serine/threonine-protein kinase [Sphaerisporangium album]RCG28279.1 serine/threonine protein kinase [Sphaerisporangium album]
MRDGTEPEGVNGRLIAGRYRLRAPIGAGGMGEVWQAYDEQFDRRVAVKMMIAERSSMVTGHPDLEALEIRRERFLREVNTTARLEHPGIPAVYDWGTDPSTGRLFVVMQLLVRGRELKTLIDESDPDDPLLVSRVAAIGAQVASVLHEVHLNDVVHRDIKPENLMLTPGGIVKVLDFGVASLIGSGTNTRLTQVGMTVGTPPYMSPEQGIANAVGPAADAYALGCVMYELFTGKPPFGQTSDRSYLWHHLNAAPPPLRRLRPDAPSEIEELLLAMLAKQAEDRPDAAEIYDALLPWAIAEPDLRGFPLDIPHLDPCLPFVRPLGGTVRTKTGPRPATDLEAAATHLNAPGSGPAGASPVAPEEVEEATGLAQRLAEDHQFVQAADVITDLLARPVNPTLANELIFALGQVKFVGGGLSEATELFEKAMLFYRDAYGPDDEFTRAARYSLAKCQEELGTVTGAIAAYEDFITYRPDPDDTEDVERHLDALASLMRLHAAANRPTRAVAIAVRLREAIIGYQGPDASGVAELDAYLARLNRLLAEDAGPDDPESDPDA